MNLVQSALRRPLTIVVLIIAIVMGALLAVREMPRDIFPTLGIPTIYVAQPYGGMDPAQMEGYLTYYYEYHFLYITGIEHVESKSIQGAAIIKLQFHPGTDMSCRPLSCALMPAVCRWGIWSSRAPIEQSANCRTWL